MPGHTSGEVGPRHGGGDVFITPSGGVTGQVSECGSAAIPCKSSCHFAAIKPDRILRAADGVGQWPESHPGERLWRRLNRHE